MAKVNLRLISYHSNSEYDYTIEESSQVVCLKDIYLNFMRKGLKIENIKQLKFLSGGKNVANLEENLYDPNTKNVIYIFTNIQELKDELMKKIFTNIPKQKESTITNLSKTFNNTLSISTKVNTEPVEDNAEEIFDPSEDEINKINEQIIDIFKNTKFQELLKTCIVNPELIKMINSYLVNGDIIDKINFDEIDIDEFKYEKEFEIINVFLKEKLQINLSDDNFVKKVLTNFKGHLNLSIRYLLNKKINIESE